MAVANITNQYLQIGETITTTGSLTFTGNGTNVVNYTLNKTGDSYTLSITPCMGIVSSQGTITSPNPFNTTQTITSQILVISTNGTQTTGIFQMTPTTIIIYSSINGTPFTTDAVHQQGWQNSIIINFSL